MKSQALMLWGYVVDNIVGMVVGGYLGYRFGDTVERAVVAVYSKLEGAVRSVAGLIRK